MEISEDMKPAIQEPPQVSASERFLFRRYKILNFRLNVLLKIGSFMQVSTVRRFSSFLKIVVHHNVPVFVAFRCLHLNQNTMIKD